MNTELIKDSSLLDRVEPLCPVFGTCGGCAYQDLPYEEELRIKEEELKNLFRRELSAGEEVFEAIVSSPEPYHYRSRLDVGLRKTRKGEYFMGFMPAHSGRIVSVDTCAIARKEISDFLPQLYEEAKKKLPENYDVANLVIKTGDDGRVFWGGIGRRSLAMNEEDYLWAEIRGRKIFYSLDTFFQANLSILPLLVEKIERHAAFDAQTVFFDLYSGAGLFGICFAGQVGKMVMIEESDASIKLAQFNARFHRLEDKIQIIEGKVEEKLPEAMRNLIQTKQIALIDPPRRGLSDEVIKMLAVFPGTLFYLSCYPPCLIRDLKIFRASGWQIEKIIPFDFFPKTAHLETLVKLTK